MIGMIDGCPDLFDPVDGCPDLLCSGIYQAVLGALMIGIFSLCLVVL
jgi:hypothetical protein